MSDLKPGWSKRQFDLASEDVRHWPQHMKTNAGLQQGDYRNESDAELELLAKVSALREELDRVNKSLEYERFRLEREIDIVNRVWTALGIETMEQANGKTVWQLVADLRKASEKPDENSPISRQVDL